MSMDQLGYFLRTFIELVKWLIIVRCILTFFPALNWDQQPWLAIRSAADPILQPFRSLIPPIAGMDFSPIVLFLLLDFLQQLIGQVF